MDHLYATAGSWMMVPNQNQPPAPAAVPPVVDQSHLLQPPPPQQQPVQHHQSLASHFHLLHLVEKLAEEIEAGTRDQHFDALIGELTGHFEKCQQLLNSISGTIGNKTVDGQKHKVEESEQLLNQRKELTAKYRSSVEELLKSDCPI